MPELRPPTECANCGAAIPRNAKACPECGADEKTGWRETSIYDGMDLPDEAWRDDTDAATQEKTDIARVNGVPWYWWLVGVLLLVLLVTSFVALR
jgi:predicted nucleic acid-binding Zn ribbon protein